MLRRKVKCLLSSNSSNMQISMFFRRVNIPKRLSVLVVIAWSSLHFASTVRRANCWNKINTFTNNRFIVLMVEIEKQTKLYLNFFQLVFFLHGKQSLSPKWREYLKCEVFFLMYSNNTVNQIWPIKSQQIIRVTKSHDSHRGLVQLQWEFQVHNAAIRKRNALKFINLLFHLTTIQSRTAHDTPVRVMWAHRPSR